MDPNKEEALNEIENSVYRTAMKLRATQTLCQLDLVAVPLIQLVLQSHRSLGKRPGLLDVAQLTDLLAELFHCARWDNPRQLDARAPGLTLSLLSAMYDKKGTGFLLLRSVGAALIALAGDALMIKYKDVIPQLASRRHQGFCMGKLYAATVFLRPNFNRRSRALFQLFAGSRERGSCPTDQLTRSALRNMLTDLQQIPAAVGETQTQGCVETAVHSCFHGVLNPGISEEKFLSWLRTEPYILLWLSTSHRLSVTETAKHHVRCGVCKDSPITGVRYRCLKCLNFDLCQGCYLTGRGNKQHKKTHPVVEHRVQQVSAQDQTKQFFRTVRNNLLRGRCERKEALMRRKELASARDREPARVQQGIPPQFPRFSSVLFRRSPTQSPRMVNAALESPACEKQSRAQQNEDMESQRPAQQTVPDQVMLCIKEELLKTRESIRALHSERRFLRKQLNRWTGKVQTFQDSQEDKNSRLETKMYLLMENNEWLQRELQRLGQTMQALLQAPQQPLPSDGHGVTPKNNTALQKCICKETVPSKTVYTKPCGQMEWQTLAQTNTVIQQALDPEIGHSVAKVMPSGASSRSLPTQDTTQALGQEVKSGRGDPLEKRQPVNLVSDNIMYPTSATSVGGTGLFATETNIGEEVEEENETKAELELQRLVEKLKDALSLEVKVGRLPYMKQEILNAADHVSRSFCDLIKGAAPPAWEYGHSKVM